MKLTYPDRFLDNEQVLMRRCGYFPIFDRRTGHSSFIRELSSVSYPRFHVYLSKADNKFIISLHLDQKKPSYGGYKAHSGEADGQVVENEANRINKILNNL
jgi:hypothetical protein